VTLAQPQCNVVVVAFSLALVPAVQSILIAAQDVTHNVSSPLLAPTAVPLFTVQGVVLVPHSAVQFVVVANVSLPHGILCCCLKHHACYSLCSFHAFSISPISLISARLILLSRM